MIFGFFSRSLQPQCSQRRRLLETVSMSWTGMCSYFNMAPKDSIESLSSPDIHASR